MESAAQRFSVRESTGIWILISTILASSLGFTATSILSVATDAIQQEFNATGVEIVWIYNAFQLLLAALILIGGSMGDHLGRRRIFGIGIVIFTAASIACGLAPNAGFLIAARGVQGIGGALMVPISLAIITALIKDEERGTAIGIWSAASTITSLGGPILGGFFVDELSWRYIFFINVPVALIALYGLTRFPENRDEQASSRLDYVGAGLIAIGLGGLTYGLSTLGDRSPEAQAAAGYAIVALIVGVVSLVGFVFWEARTPNPMVDLRLFRSRMFAGTNAMTATLYGALAFFPLVLPLYLIQIQGYQAAEAGIAQIPASILLAVMSPFMAGLLKRVGPRLLLTMGPFIAGIGFALTALPGVTNGFSDYLTTFFPAILIIGLGMGITVAPLTTSVMSSVPSEKAGVASGVNNAVTRSASVLTTAIFGAMMLFFFSSALMSRTEALGLSPEARAEVEASAALLAQTPVPESLPAESAEAFTQAVRWAFVDMFRILALTVAGLAWISALLSWTIIERKSEIDVPQPVPLGAD